VEKGGRNIRVKPPPQENCVEKGGRNIRVKPPPIGELCGKRR
jgi:hypothetical protein